MIITDSTYRDDDLYYYHPHIKLKAQYDFDDLDDTWLRLKDIKEIDRENEFMDLLNKHFNNKIPSEDEFTDFIVNHRSEIVNQLKNTPKSNDNSLRIVEFYYDVSIYGTPDKGEMDLEDIYDSNELIDFIIELTDLKLEWAVDYDEDGAIYESEPIPNYAIPSTVFVIEQYYKKGFGGRIPSMEEFKNYILQNKEQIKKDVIEEINNDLGGHNLIK